jgi:acyl-CoA synthetase (AMP-forming)/AMP-acid ligase II/acyl carrier protein
MDRRRDSKAAERLQDQPVDEKAARRIFLNIGDLVAHYGRVAYDRDAIVGFGQNPLSYGALRVEVNDAVRGLRSLGVRRGDRVAVALTDGPETAVAIIAVAAAAVCVPLNPDFTAEEWRRYFEDLQPAVLLTRMDIDSASRSVAHSLTIPVIDLFPRPGKGSGAFGLRGSGTGRAVSSEVVPTADDDAFILLSSGTTARPKMVPLTHAAVCQSAYNAGAVLQLGPSDRLLGVLPLFHAHGLISGLLTALAAGSSVVCTPGFDPAAFFGWLTEFRPTWYTAVPAIHRVVLSHAASHKDGLRGSSLRIIRSASASLPPAVLRELESLFGVPVIETYGMTEAASQIAANPLARRKAGSVGLPAGAEIAIIDCEGRSLPTGKHGEIALRGPTITRGYCNDAAATESAFRDGWLRTGDFGYLDSDGYLFIIGRLKEVIKRGGQQVAPAEVEQALLSHSEVVEAAVFAVPHELLGENVAAAVVLKPHATATAEKLRIFACERLASFKVPGPIHIVPEIPKGPGGKLRRSGLAAALSITSPTRRDSKRVYPPSALERQLAELWANLLGIAQIDIDQDVFALGADSISVTEMLFCLWARFGTDFSFEDVFYAPTVRALAARLERGAGDLALSSRSSCFAPSRPLRRHREDAQPVSLVQEQVLRTERAFPGLPHFNRAFAYRLEGPLDVLALERSLAEVVRRHASLRTRFGWRKDVPLALVAPAAEPLSPLTIENLAASLPDSDTAKALLLEKAELVAEQEALKPFNIQSEPLFRRRLLRLGNDDYFLLLTVHDLVVDGWSIGILIEDVSALYGAFAADQPVQLPEPPLQFCDFARFQRQWVNSSAAAAQFAYWKDRLRNVSPAFDVAPNAGGTVSAAPRVEEEVHLSNDLLARLRDLGHSQGSTLFMTLLAGLRVLLLARSGRNDICLVTAMANRCRPGTERVIGPFANTTVIRTQMGPDLSFPEAIGRARDAVLEAYARQELPFEIIAARMVQEDGLDPASLVQISFVLDNAFRRSLKLRDLVVRPFAQQEPQLALPIDPSLFAMTLKETPSGLGGTCRHKLDLLDSKAWIEDYSTILTKAAAHPGLPLGNLIAGFEHGA